MSKHQRSNKEAKKPKQDKAVLPAAVALKSRVEPRSATVDLFAADRAARAKRA